MASHSAAGLIQAHRATRNSTREPSGCPLAGPLDCAHFERGHRSRAFGDGQPVTDDDRRRTVLPCEPGGASLAVATARRDVFEVDAPNVVDGARLDKGGRNIPSTAEWLTSSATLRRDPAEDPAHDEL